MNRVKFKKELIKKMSEIKYEPFLSTSEMKFVKYIGNGFYNILYITFSRYTVGRFTGDFFLSLYPSNIYEENGKRRIYSERIAFFLTKEERIRLLNSEKENISTNCGDAWWYDSDPTAIADFVDAVNCAEKRFLSQEFIYEQVLDNERLRWFYNKNVLKIIDLAYSEKLEENEYSCIPKTDPDKIGMNWFKAAEIFIREHSKMYKLRSYWVKELASEAYMTDKYEKLNGPYNPILLELKQKSFDDFFKKD